MAMLEQIQQFLWEEDGVTCVLAPFVSYTVEGLRMRSRNGAEPVFTERPNNIFVFYIYIQYFLLNTYPFFAFSLLISSPEP